MANSITPPPELLREWCAHNSEHENYEQFWHYIAAQAAQWGADQELEACCDHVDWVIGGLESKELRAARRPKPPSLKEQALALLDKAEDPSWDINDFSIVRQVLGALPND